MIVSLLCLAFPLLLLYAAWHDVSTMTIPNWVSISLGVLFVPAALAALLFAAAEALGIRLQASGLHLPNWLTQLIPYALTLVALLLRGTLGTRRQLAPAALGQPRD